MPPIPSPSDRVALHTKRAADAMKSLKAASTDLERLDAAKALESAACQLRRALKAATS